MDAPGAELAGVFNLRFEEDAGRLREAAGAARRAVVLGGSYLGVETAASLKQLGLDVVIVERSLAILPRVEAPEISAFFKRYLEELGLSIFLNDSIIALHGATHIQEAETASGQRLPCDLVVVAIGILPASGFLAGSGIALDDGYIAVDDRLRANVPNVYAAGDVTSFYDPVFARRRHIEHWDNAVKQGRLAALNMLGRRMRYDELSYYFCDVGSISFDVLGAPEEADRRIGRSSLDARSYALFYLKNDIVRALFSTGRPVGETRGAEQLIRYRTNVSIIEERLPDTAFALDTIPPQTALVLQGGGALGAFECGVVKALEDAKIFPDVVAGVSIGALNGAIVAGNPGKAAPALEAFWRELTVSAPALFPFPAQFFGGAAIATGILGFGVPKFFRPRWIPPYRPSDVAPMTWTSFYDPSPMKALIAKYVDFAALKKSPVRLLISAVNVKTAELRVFDSYVDDLTPDHLLASGSLPPGFPWTVIDGQPYWDGGIISNSPLDLVTDLCGLAGIRVFIVDLFLGQRALPSNMMEVLARRDEIVYSERIRSDLHYRETVNAYRSLIDDIAGRLAPEEREKIEQRPTYIQLMGDGQPISVVRLVRPAREGEQASRDYDFSDIAIQAHQREVAKQAVRNL
jgi:predicted acylesterase/phospholipase RssA